MSATLRKKGCIGGALLRLFSKQLFHRVAMGDKADRGLTNIDMGCMLISFKKTRKAFP